MASALAGIASSFSPPPLLSRFNNKLLATGSCRLVKQRCCCCCCNQSEAERWYLYVMKSNSFGVQQENGAFSNNRRQVLVGITLTTCLAAFPFSNASADTDVEEGFRIYTDDDNKFTIYIPVGWRVGVGEGEPNGFKSVTAFYPPETTSSNVSVIITGLGPDFTKMESFGKVDEFAETLVSGLDRSWQRPSGVAAKLINSKSKNGFYYIDYSLQSPGEPRKYLYSALGMASNGWYNRLYTVTGQFEEDDSAKYGSAIQKAVASFRFI